MSLKPKRPWNWLNLVSSAWQVYVFGVGGGGWVMVYKWCKIIKMGNRGSVKVIPVVCRTGFWQ